MPNPAYISSVDVHYNNVNIDCAVFLAGPPKILIRYDGLDTKGREHLAYLVAQNGGTLPFLTLNPLYNTLLDNNRTYFDTYAKSIVSHTSVAPAPGSPVDSDLKYYNGSAWVSVAT